MAEAAGGIDYFAGMNNYTPSPKKWELTPRENLLETLKGPDGNPERFVKQYEYMYLVPDPINKHCGGQISPGSRTTLDWGYTLDWTNTALPGPFPVEDPEHLPITDIENWRDQLVIPDPKKYADAEWKEVKDEIDKVDRSLHFVSPFFTVGIFERLHYLMGIKECLMNMALYPDEITDLINAIADWEIEYADLAMDRLGYDLLFHHDDWGSQATTFMSPGMFEEFFVEPYKRIYSHWKDLGVELVVHHNDSYSREFIPYMKEMGIDIWQGPVSDNKIAECMKGYPGALTYHGGLDNGVFDRADYNDDELRAYLRKLIEDTDGGKYLIPGLCAGGPGSTFPGVYEKIDKAIDDMSLEFFD